MGYSLLGMAAAVAAEAMNGGDPKLLKLVYGLFFKCLTTVQYLQCFILVGVV